MSIDIYQENGFENRNEYLKYISDEYDTPLSTVLAIADLLGESEDFDGLITAFDN